LAKALPSQPRTLNLEPKCLYDILDNVVAVAAAMGHAEKGTEICGRLQRRIADVQERVGGLSRRTVFIMEWAEPIFNSGHWNPELIRLAQGMSVLSPEGEYSVRVPWQDLRAADPEILIIACCGNDIERTRMDMPSLEALPGWQKLNAVRNCRTYLANGSAYFSRPGPRIVDTLEILASIIHPRPCRGLYPNRGTVQVYL
jgi:iron complex transport system substrate-binding protein